MKPLTRPALIALACVPLLGGCAGLFVGGAATAVSVAHDRRTAGTVVEDESIETKSVGDLDRAGLNGRAHINVTSYNRVVLLSGEVPDQASRARAESIVGNVAEVRSVFNELAVASNSSLGSRSSDTWITTKVKSALLEVDGIRDFDPTRVKVVTERGIVYLMGLVRQSEAESVTRSVRRVSGVQRVVRLFEYMD